MRIVIVNRFGRLGNRLHVFAHWIAYARSRGLTLYNPGFYDYERYFEGTKNNLRNRYPKPNFKVPQAVVSLYKAVPRFQRRVDLRIDWAVWESSRYVISDVELDQLIKGKRVLRVWDDCMFRTAEILSFQDEVRVFFKPVEDLSLRVQSTVQAIRKSGTVLVGVHIRRADYRQFLDGNLFFSDEEYLAIMLRARTLIGRPCSFLLVSDETLELANFHDLTCHRGDGDPVVDMYSLAECDYIIGPQSSFNTWASFYGKKPLYRILDPKASFTLESFKVHILYND